MPAARDLARGRRECAQAALLRFIAGYVEAHGRSPTYRAICDGTGCGKGHVGVMLARLAERGAIRLGPRGRYGQRAIVVTRAPVVPRGPRGEPLFFVPVRSAVFHGGSNA